MWNSFFWGGVGIELTGGLGVWIQCSVYPIVLLREEGRG